MKIAVSQGPRGSAKGSDLAEISENKVLFPKTKNNRKDNLSIVASAIQWAAPRAAGSRSLGVTGIPSISLSCSFFTGVHMATRQASISTKCRHAQPSGRAPSRSTARASSWRSETRARQCRCHCPRHPARHARMHERRAGSTPPHRLALLFAAAACTVEHARGGAPRPTPHVAGLGPRGRPAGCRRSRAASHRPARALRTRASTAQPRECVDRETACIVTTTCAGACTWPAWPRSGGVRGDSLVGEAPLISEKASRISSSV